MCLIFEKIFIQVSFKPDKVGYNASILIYEEKKSSLPLTLENFEFDFIL